MSFGRHPRPPHRHLGPGGQDFAHVTNSGGAIAILNEGTIVTFPTFQNIGDGILINRRNDRLTIEHPGNYFIVYSVNTTSSSTFSTRILVNGRTVNATTIEPVVSQTNFNNQIILPLEPGDMISLELFGITGIATLINGAGATLTVFRIG